MPQTLIGTVKIEIFAGELIDKLTILQIKVARFQGPDKLADVHRRRDNIFSKCPWAETLAYPGR